MALPSPTEPFSVSLMSRGLESMGSVPCACVMAYTSSVPGSVQADRYVMGEPSPALSSLSLTASNT